MLVCPVTHGPLRYDRVRNELVSHQLGRAFPIRDGVPIMLLDETRELAEDEKRPTNVTDAPTRPRSDQRRQADPADRFRERRKLALSAELLGSTPSAEVQGHGAGQKVTPKDKQNVRITASSPSEIMPFARFRRRPQYRHLQLGYSFRLRPAAGQPDGGLSRAPRRRLTDTT